MIINLKEPKMMKNLIFIVFSIALLTQSCSQSDDFIDKQSVFEEEMWLEYMAWNSYSCGGALSALYEQLTVISEQ